MAFEFQHNSAEPAGRIALFPGAFNPPTVAHLAIARAALAWADQVAWVLPRQLPHKSYEGVSFADRLRMVQAAIQSEPRFLCAVAGGGLYIDIAQAARELLGAESEIALVCGRDAAERIAAWNYGREGVFQELLAAFPLLVAARSGDYRVPVEHNGRIVPLKMEVSFDDVSSSEIRDRIAAGKPWRHLTPQPIHELVSQLYT